MTEEEDAEVASEGMKFTHENLELILKSAFEKLRVHLCLKFSPDDYNVVLSDGLASDAVVQNGGVVVIKIKTLRLVSAMTKRGLGDDFRQLLESCLRMVPRMRDVLGHRPIADVLVRNEETGKFSRMSQEDYASLTAEHPYEKEIHYRTEFRVTAIHWKAGVVVRETGLNAESAYHKSRRRILSILSDKDVYNRTETGFVAVESHGDIIHDLVVEARTLDKLEVAQLIHSLQQEYLR